MQSIILSPEILVVIAGAILSLAFSYIPGLNTRYAALDETTKRLVMASILLVVTVVIYILGCGGLLATGIPCDRSGIVQLTYMFILAIMANQGAYEISPRTDAVKAAKGSPG